MVKVTDFGLIEKYICVETDRNVWYFALGKKIQCLFAHLGPARHIHVISKATPREPILVPISEVRELCCYTDMEDYEADFLSLSPYTFVMN